MSKFRLLFGLFLILAGLSSCRPKHVLSRSEMTDVLYDIHLTEALTNDDDAPIPPQWMRGMNKFDFRDMAYQTVFKKHEITDEIFFTSVDYYSKHLRLYSKIYVDVNARLNIFIEDVKNGKYGVSINDSLRGLTHLDTVQCRKWFECLLAKSSNIPNKKMFLPADSLLSYTEYITSKWLYKDTCNRDTFSVVSLLKKTEKPATDSIRKIDSLSSGPNAKKIDTLKREVAAEVPKNLHSRIRQPINSAKKLPVKSMLK